MHSKYDVPSSTTMRIHLRLLIAAGITLCSGQCDHDERKPASIDERKPAANQPVQPTGTPTPAPEQWYGQDNDAIRSSYGTPSLSYGPGASYGPPEAGMMYEQDNDVDFEHDTAVAIRVSLGDSSTTHNVNGKRRKKALSSRRRVRSCTGPETKGELKSPPEELVAATSSTSLTRSSTALVPTSTALEVSVLLGLNPDDIAGRTFNDIVDTILLLGETQDDLVGVLHSHGAVNVNAVGIHWHITDRNSDTSVPRYSRASFVHYPPTGVREHVNAAGDGTCSTFRVVARAVNDARMAVGQSRVPFADMWDGLFDLMPVPFDIGYNFGSDYYNDLVPTFREEYDQAQTRVVTAFFLSEIRKGRIGCRGLVTGAVPMDRWPTYIERATRAANLIAMSLGYHDTNIR